jgi:hypothetical protein
MHAAHRSAPRVRKGFAPTCLTSEHGADADLPGLRWDEAKQRYFKILVCAHGQSSRVEDTGFEPVLRGFQQRQSVAQAVRERARLPRRRRHLQHQSSFCLGSALGLLAVVGLRLLVARE